MRRGKYSRHIGEDRINKYRLGREGKGRVEVRMMGKGARYMTVYSHHNSMGRREKGRGEGRDPGL